MSADVGLVERSIAMPQTVLAEVRHGLVTAVTAAHAMTISRNMTAPVMALLLLS
jgi:hypothetical protein